MYPTIETNQAQQVAFVKLNGSQKKKDMNVVKGPVGREYDGMEGK